MNLDGPKDTKKEMLKCSINIDFNQYLRKAICLYTCQSYCTTHPSVLSSLDQKIYANPKIMRKI